MAVIPQRRFDCLVESCRICGGDRWIASSFGGAAKTCPACHGTGRRVEEALSREVAKAQWSHHSSATANLKETSAARHGAPSRRKTRRSECF